MTGVTEAAAGERVLRLLDRCAEAGADEVTVRPVGVTLLRLGAVCALWGEGGAGVTLEELQRASSPARESVELGAHPVLLNFLHPPSGATETVWRLAVEGGHIRLGDSPAHLG